uniref:Uncharacterized protein n=1 Tax=Oryza brachyantha TaxID=4533 RepID=J3KWK9_ORYBR
MEAEAEPEPDVTWEALFQRRVVMAEGHCLNLQELLRGLLDAPDGQARSDMAGMEEMLRGLEAASTQVGLAIANMGAACNLAPIGKAPREWAPPPLHSADDDDFDSRVWLVHFLLQKGSEIAKRVHDRLETARVHMSAAAEILEVLGGDDHSPWVEDLAITELMYGLLELTETLDLTVDLVAVTTTAREDVFSDSGGVG